MARMDLWLVFICLTWAYWLLRCSQSFLWLPQTKSCPLNIKISLFDLQTSNVALKSIVQLFALSLLNLLLLFAHLDYELACLLLLLLFFPALVLSLGSLLLDGHDLVIMDLLQCHLSPFFLPPIILQELVHVIILVLVKTFLYAILIDETAINVFVPRYWVLLKIVFIGGHEFVPATLSSTRSWHHTIFILFIFFLFRQGAHFYILGHI